MIILQYYIILACIYTCYTLGVMRGNGHTNWKNCVMAILIGSVWPVAVCYGVYVVHFKNTTNQ